MKKFNIEERIPMFLIGMLIAGILLASSAFPASAVSRIYTTDADFNEGVLVGLEHETVHDQLQLNITSTAFPFIWVPNTGEGTISKVDTRTGNETGRYRVTPPGLPDNGSPSRTTVDLEGNVWVGNRQAGTVVKVGLYELGSEVNQCIDRNGNNSIETSLDADDDGNITGSELLPWGQDECVLYEVVLIPGSEGTYVPGTYGGSYDTNYFGTSPRGLAIDANNNLWAGTSTTYKYYHINGSTGQIMQTLDVSPWSSGTSGAYGATIDKNGILWSAMLGAGVLRINTSNLGDISFISVSGTYGIGLDSLGHLFDGGSSLLTKINTSDSAVLWTKSARTVRGVVATADSNVWVAGYDQFWNYAGVTRYDNDGNELAVINGFNAPSGVAVDSNGKVWVTDIGSDNIYRIDPATNATDLTKAIVGSGGHYTYSDMTGYVAKTITTTIGTWTVTNDSGSNSTVWGRVSLNDSIPAGASIELRVRTNNDSNNLPSSIYQPVSNGIDFYAIGRYIQIETRLIAGSTKESPVLYDLIVENINATKSITGMKFNDSNGNKKRDPGESGVPGIGIRLTRKYIPPDIGSNSFAGFTYTDMNGNYSFMNLVVGASYIIAEELSDFATQTSPDGGSPHEITYNGTKAQRDFGNQPVPGGVIRGTKFNDTNGNGTQDAGETGIQGVTICLWPSTRCTTTDNSGNYTFSNVAVGTQTVYEHVPQDNISTTPSMVTVSVISGGVTIVNFGNRMLVPPPPDVTVQGELSDATDFYGVPVVLNVNQLVIRKDLSSYLPPSEVVAVELRLTWSDGTIRTQNMTQIGTTGVWEATFNPPFPSGAAQMNFSVHRAIPSDDFIQIGDLIFVDPSGRILDACSGAPINGATATLLIEAPPTTGNFIVSPPANQIPPANPQTTGADGMYSWNVVPGTYKVRAEMTGYMATESLPVSIPPPVFNLDISLTPTSGCPEVKVEGNGWIKSPNTPVKKNDKATFDFKAGNKKGSIDGKLGYHDHAIEMKVDSINLTALMVDKINMRATFSGFAKVTNAAKVTTVEPYTVMVWDNSKKGKSSDRINITLGNGYTANETLGGGSIRVDK